MKRVFSIILVLATLSLSLSAFSILTCAAEFDGNYDTLENQLLNDAAEEYYIEDAEDYKTFIRELEKAGAGLENTSGTAEAAALIYVTGTGAFAGKTVYLAEDINVEAALDADDSSDFGTNDKLSVAGTLESVKGFSGTFDGLGHTVSGVCLVSEVASGGSLFGYATGNVTLRNVTFENCYLQNKNPGLAALFTSVANDATCTIENVDVADDVVLLSLRETNLAGYVGGFIGNIGAATVSIKNSTFGGQIILRTEVDLHYVGGLVGSVMNHAKALASPILDMENCGFFGEITWNKNSLAVSKFIGVLHAPTGDALSLPIRVSAKNCIVSGKISQGDALLIGGYQGASSGTSIKVSLENTVWTAEDRLLDLGAKIGTTSQDCISITQKNSGYIAKINSQTLLSGDALDKDAKNIGQKYDLTGSWACVSETPAPLSLLGSKNAGQGTQLLEGATHYVGYQAKKSALGHSVRFIATGNDAQYDRVGMTIMLDTFDLDQSTDKVYTTLASSGRQVSAESLGGQYLYVAQGDIPSNGGRLSGLVITWHEEDGQRYYGSVRNLSIDAACVITESLGITSDYKIYTYSGLSDFDDELSAAIKAKTGLSLTTSASTAGKRIFLGTAESFAGVAGMSAPSYTAYQIKTVDDDIYISVGTSSATENASASMTVPTAIEALVSAIKVQNGEPMVGAELDMSGDLSLISERVPLLSGKTPSMIFACGADNYQAKYEEVGVSVVDEYKNTLVANGFTHYTDNEINGNKFATYKKGDAHVNLSYFPYYSLFHISYGLDDLVIPTSPVTGYTTVAQPTLSMLQLTETGLSMVVQCPDGSFVIIDGGTRSEKNNYGKLNKQVLWDFLQSKLPEGESKPRITWILTHAHNDHVTLPNSVLRERCDEIILERVIYNFPDMNDTRVKAINLTLAYYYPDTPIWTPHTGDVLYLPGCEIEFLYTHEDLSGKLTDGNSVNNASIVCRITMEGNTCMAFADVMVQASTHMYNVYGSTLKSDVMQVPHHGAGTASWEVYSAVDPDICLWSVGRYKYDNDVRMLGTKKNMDYNAKLRDPAYGVREHYTLSETVTINMKTLVASVYVDQATRDALLAEDQATVQTK